MYFQRGLSLLELMVTVSIIAIVVSIGAPAVLKTQKTMQLKGAVETSYFAFQQARSSAISSASDVTVSITAGTNWCVAISDGGDCDCNTLNSCTINGVEQIIKARDFHMVTMEELSFGASSSADFDGVRGLSIGSAGSTIFSDGTNKAKLVLSNMGRARICMDEGNLGSYSAC
jgi:prepilin peptidase dependent protein A/type IV fimbrial biogenesis protein FimT